jgi:hypothetical protein
MFEIRSSLVDFVSLRLPGTVGQAAYSCITKKNKKIARFEKFDPFGGQARAYYNMTWSKPKSSSTWWHLALYLAMMAESLGQPWV